MIRALATGESVTEFNRRSNSAAVAAGLGMFVGPTPMASVAAALFLVPLRNEFGLTTGQMSWLLLVQPVTVALCSAWAGRLLDRYGVRRVLLPAVALFALTMLYMGTVRSVPQLILGFIVMGLCVSVHCYSSYTKVLSQWFDRHRGLVMGVAITFGSGMGAFTLPRVAGPWIQSQGWRSTYVLMAGMIAVIGLPALWLFLREPRSGEGPVRATASGTAAEAATAIGLTRGEAMRTSAFWLIAAAMYLAPMAVVGTVQHSFAMLTERQFTPAEAGAALSVVYLGGMAGYITTGLLLERVSSPKVALLYFAAALFGLWLLHSTRDASLLQPAAMLMGLGQGAEMCIAAYLSSRYFGLKAYGAIYGTFYSIGNAGIASGIVLMGLVHDHTGSYAPMRAVFMCNLAVVVLAFALLPRYRYARAPGA
jgi:MFS family permease